MGSPKCMGGGPNLIEKGIKIKVAGPGQASHTAGFWPRALKSLRILNFILTFWVIIKVKIRTLFVTVSLIYFLTV